MPWKNFWKLNMRTCLTYPISSQVLSRYYITFMWLKILNNTFSVRWVSSHLRAIIKILENWPKLVRFLKDVIQKTSEYSKNTIKDAQILLDWLTNKHFITSLVFNVDLQTLFKYMSQTYQRKFDSVIGNYTWFSLKVDSKHRILNLRTWWEETKTENQLGKFVYWGWAKT